MKFPYRRLLRVLLLILLGHAIGAISALAEEREQTALGKEMETISKNLRVLRRQILDPEKKEASLSLLTGMETSAGRGKELVPARAKEMAEDKRAEFVTAFQAEMEELIGALKKIEIDVRESRFAEAKVALSTLQTLKRKGHEQFSAEKEE